MDPILIGILWAVFGAVSYKLTSSLFSCAAYSLFAKKVVVHSLKLIGAVVEDLAFVRELKYIQMAKSGMADEQIDFVKKVDEQTLNNWKQNSINIFKSSFPGVLEAVVKFNTWDEAMRELDKIYKEENKP
jgi:hypothetical protein